MTDLIPSSQYGDRLTEADLSTMQNRVDNGWRLRGDINRLIEEVRTLSAQKPHVWINVYKSGCIPNTPGISPSDYRIFAYTTEEDALQCRRDGCLATAGIPLTEPK